MQNKRAIVVAGHEDAVMTTTTAADLAAIVARAVEYDGKWPVNGGISGNRLTYAQIIEIGEKIRGRYRVSLTRSLFAPLVWAGFNEIAKQSVPRILTREYHFQASPSLSRKSNCPTSKQAS